MTMEELTHTLREMGQPAFRGGQVFTWLHRGVTSFEEMSDLPRTLREAGLTDKALLPGIRDLAINDGALLYNRKDADRDQLLALLERAWE
jgi:adenine C2-methylase RlmN of 23S rRNA A2503 and tRNA A37